MKLNKLFLLVMALIVIVISVSATSAFTYNAINNKVTDTKSMVIWSGIIDTTSTLISSSFSMTKYNTDYSKFLGKMFYDVTITPANITDTVSVKIIEMGSADNGTSYAVIDTITTITVAGYHLVPVVFDVEKIYDYRRLFVQGADTTNADSVSFVIRAIYNYKK